jgi:LysM repeat protein
MSGTPTVKIIPESYPGADLTFILGSETPAPVVNTGIAKYNTITRPRRRDLNEFAGESLLEITFSIICNEWPDGNVINQYGRVYGWASRNGLPTMPTVLRTEGPIPHSNLRWTLTGIEQMEVRQRVSDWALCYFELKLTLTEWVDADLIIQGIPAPASPSPAKDAQQRFQQQYADDIARNPKLALAFGVPYTGGIGQSQPKTYTVKKGDTLSKIAASQLGKSSRWQEIANLNGIRDPNKINIGQVLKMPA